MASDQTRLRNAVGALRVLGVIASIAGGFAISALVMVGIVGNNLPDSALIALASACSLIVVIWGSKGGRPPSKWLMAGGLFPCMMLGICVLMGAYERYPLFSKWLMGALAVFIFVVVGIAASWRAICSGEDFSIEGAAGGRLGKVFSVTSTFIFAGVLFFQPLLVLLNGSSQSRPPSVYVGTIVQAYETHGKGAANYVVFKGPAAAYHSTWTAGEFEVDWPTYRSSPVGSERCLTIRTGVLRFKWWSINDC